MKLSANFSLYEFTRSQTATRRQIDNTPDNQTLVNLVHLAQALQAVRSACGDRSITVSSGYRSVELNRAIGGSATSHHCKGLAADFTVSGISVADTVNIIRGAGVPYSQLIDEFSSWVHFAIHPLNESLQGEYMLARKVNGQTEYRVG